VRIRAESGAIDTRNGRDRDGARSRNRAVGLRKCGYGRGQIVPRRADWRDIGNGCAGDIAQCPGARRRGNRPAHPRLRRNRIARSPSVPASGRLGRLPVLGMIETMLAGTVTVAEPTVLLEMDVAVMVTVISLGGGFGGALYVTDVPVAALSVPAPDAGEIAQVTLVCRGSYCTVAISPCVLPAGTERRVGTTDTTLRGHRDGRPRPTSHCRRPQLR